MTPDRRPAPVTPRHQFLRNLHDLLKPATYLEIGVQRGWSLSQARPDTFAHAIDPQPMIEVPIAARYKLYVETSDEFFAQWPRRTNDRLQPPEPALGLAFIDGMHLVENVLRDFIGVEQLMSRSGVVVFDDVLPYSADIAGREPLSGDWAGDVWKIVEILDSYRFLDLQLIPVDVAPTGALVVLGLNPTDTILAEAYPKIVERFAREIPLPSRDRYLDRNNVVPPSKALDIIADRLNLNHPEKGTT